MADLAALRAVGLTDYGARTYSALVGLGSATGPEIATASGVPRTRVYSVLQDLARRGWVDAEGGRPRRFVARRPSECFARERSRLDAAAAASLPELEARFTDRSKRFAGTLWLVEGAAAIAARAAEMVKRAKQEVLLAASFPLPGDDGLARETRAAARRDVRVRVVAPHGEAAAAFVAPGVEVRTLLVPPRALFVDGREALLAFPAPDGPLRGIWHASPEIMQIMGGVVGFLWAQATPVEVRASRRAG